MPYYVHRKDESPDSARLCCFTAADAFQLKESGEIATYVENNKESEWRYREEGRFDNGTYISVPWPDYFDYTANHHHYCHMSLKHAGKVAYTKTPEHGAQDRQIVVRPGKYLIEYFPDFAELHKDWIGKVCALKHGLKIAKTADEIQRVYVGGPRSCMSHSPDTYSGHIHPVQVYGESDLAIAYIGDIDHAQARAIIWPDKMLYGRTYGNEEVLKALLVDAGYNHSDDYGDWFGAKIRRIANERGMGGWIMPYLDIGETVDAASRGFFKVAGVDGSFDARQTNGTTNEPTYCEHCEDNTCDDDESFCASCLEDSSICPDCDNRNWDGNTNGYCDSCYENYSDCAKCSELVYTDNLQYLEEHEESFCEDCIGDSHVCDVCEERFIHEAYCIRVRRNRPESVRYRICNSCLEKGAFVCSECDDASNGDNHDGVCADCYDPSDSSANDMIAEGAPCAS